MLIFLVSLYTLTIVLHSNASSPGIVLLIHRKGFLGQSIPGCLYKCMFCICMAIKVSPKNLFKIRNIKILYMVQMILSRRFNNATHFSTATTLYLIHMTHIFRHKGAQPFRAELYTGILPSANATRLS